LQPTCGTVLRFRAKSCERLCVVMSFHVLLTRGVCSRGSAATAVRTKLFSSARQTFRVTVLLIFLFAVREMQRDVTKLSPRQAELSVDSIILLDARRASRSLDLKLLKCFGEVVEQGCTEEQKKAGKGLGGYGPACW
jgi:hypothetical protein